MHFDCTCRSFPLLVTRVLKLPWHPQIDKAPFRWDWRCFENLKAQTLQRMYTFMLDPQGLQLVPAKPGSSPTVLAFRCANCSCTTSQWIPKGKPSMDPPQRLFLRCFGCPPSSSAPLRQDPTSAWRSTASSGARIARDGKGTDGT